MLSDSHTIYDLGIRSRQLHVDHIWNLYSSNWIRNLVLDCLGIFSIPIAINIDMKQG